MTTIYEDLTESVKVLPEEGEDEQTYLKRLAKAVSDLPEPKWDELSETAQHWFNDASDALTAKKPIPKLPGAPFEDKVEAEEDPAPPKRAAAKGGDKKADKKAAGKAAAKPASGKEAKPAAKTKEAAKPPAKAEAKPAAKKETKPKEPAKPREKKTGGVLDLLMTAVYHNPSETPQQLQARVAAANPGMEVKLANAIGIRQQYRRIVRFLQTQGHVKELHTE